MALFNNFPIIAYNNVAVRDLSIRVAFRKVIKEHKDLYFLYDVEDMELPEHIAYNRYGDSGLHWIILFMNDIIDPWYDWPLSTREMSRYVTAKYDAPTIVDGDWTNDGFNGVHHYETDGQVYYYNPPDAPLYPAPVDAIPITFLEYEERLNDAKRRVKIIYPEYVGRIEREMKFVIDNGY